MDGQKASGGRGGHAYVNGDHSSAEGGQGGDAVMGDGGQGGDAMVIAENSKAVGGRGGRGGVGPGGRGGNVRVLRNPAALEQALRGEEDNKAGAPGGEAPAVGEGLNNVFAVGGQGGEASQPDGRGGRGGRSHMPPEIGRRFSLLDRAHMRWPYFEPITEPGRGGDSPDTPQYMARRLIVERLKRDYFKSQSLCLDEVWWDRQLVSLRWINERLEAEGHRWRASVVDDEYEFTDVARHSDITA